MIREPMYFEGRILTDGGAEILEVGIEISTSLGFRKKLSAVLPNW